MADEQIIYLSPEEDLTTVRERLDRSHAQRIILIIPPQTQLRSNVSWRLLHSRARALGKDVLVISSDRQIRAVVKAAGFRVAESQESPPSASTRPGSRPSRSGSSGRTAARLRTLHGKGTPDGRGSSAGMRTPQRQQPAPSNYVIEEQVMTPQEPESRSQERIEDQVTHPSVPAFEEPEQQFGPDYDFRAHTEPPSEADAEQDIDEHELLVNDYNVAQGIREAAQRNEAEIVTEPPTAETITEPAEADDETELAIPEVPESHDIMQPTRDIGDPFMLMEDRESVRLPEQRGSAPIDELDGGVPDISDYPTEVMMDNDIEDLGDEGDIVTHDEPAKSFDEDVDTDTELVESPGTYGWPQRNRESSLTQEIDEDALPPPIQTTPPASPVIPPVPSEPGRPYVVQPPSTPRPRTAPGSSRPPGRTMPAASAQQRATRRSSAVVGTSRPPARSQPGRVAAARPRDRSIMIIPAIILILLLVAILAYGYLAPTADVTITLPSQTFSTPLALTASANSPQDAAGQTVRAQNVKFDMSMSKIGHVTGSKQVGTTPATGQVVFTNHGNQSVDIPNGTIIASSSGVQFMTTSDVLVPTVGSNIGNAIPDPVQSVSTGTSGNVPANSITVIPTQSLSKISQANPSVQVNVSVTNPAAITNGGVGSAPAVTQSDVQTLKTALVQQLQQQAKTWLAKQGQNGNVTGQPVQTLIDMPSPAVGQVAPNGTVSEQVSLHMTVLLVRAADLQSVAQAVFNTAASKSKPNYALAPGQMLSLAKATVKNCTPSTGKTSLTLCYLASGPIAPQIPVQQVRDALAGKTVKDATNYLNSITQGIGSANTPPVITIRPSFFPWLPYWSQHITIHMRIIPPPSTPKK